MALIPSAVYVPAPYPLIPQRAFSERLICIAGTTASKHKDPQLPNYQPTAARTDVTEVLMRIAGASAFAPSPPSWLTHRSSFRRCRFPAMQAPMIMADVAPSPMPERLMDSTAVAPISSLIGRSPPSTLRPGAGRAVVRYNWCHMQARTVERLVPKQAVTVSCENNTST